MGTIASLEDEVKRADMSKKAARLFEAARTQLILGKTPSRVFFATPALRLEVREVDPADPNEAHVKTAGTDGRKLVYDPEFVCSLSLDETVALVAHEVFHCIMNHTTRRQNRAHGRWNVAADIAINHPLKDAGFALPSCAVYAEQFNLKPGNTSEGYYSDLPNDKDYGGGGEFGEVMDGPGDAAAKAQLEAEWTVTAAQAAYMAKQKGDLPDSIARIVDRILKPKVNWKAVLHEFISSNCRDDYRWFPPNRRWIWRDIYLPSLQGEKVDGLVLAVDTSGSIGQEELDLFAAEIRSILETFNTDLTILYHDSCIQHVQKWKSSDGPIKLEPKGGGGTSHVPVFEHIQKENMRPTALICLTDMYSSFPKIAPDYPVMWCITGNPSPSVPFGRTLMLEF